MSLDLTLFLFEVFYKEVGTLKRFLTQCQHLKPLKIIKPEIMCY